MKDARPKKVAPRFYMVKTRTGEQIAIVHPEPPRPIRAYLVDLDRVNPSNAPNTATYIP